MNLHKASPEAIAFAFAAALVREHGDDASRLADLVVKHVQDEMRKAREVRDE